MAKNHFIRLALALMLLAACLAPLPALDPALELDEYAVERYTTENGLPQSSVMALVQTRDGYLWLGTYEGLARFDGQAFTIFDKSNTPEMESNSIKALAEDAQGRLWVGTTSGLLRYGNGRFERFDERHGLKSHFILCLHFDHRGTLWAGTTHGLHRLEDGRFRLVAGAQGLASAYVNALADDGTGGMWIGTGQGLNHMQGDRIRGFTTVNGLPHNDIRALHLDRRGTLWIGTSGGSLTRYHDGRFEPLAERLSSNDIRAIFMDSQGMVWIGTNQDLNRIKDGKVAVMGQRLGGLMSARAILEDREGSLWVGTRDGLLQLKDDKFILYGSRNGLPVDPVRAVFEDRQGSLWVGTVGGGLVRRQDGTWRTYGPQQGLSSEHVWSIAQGRDGALWAGTYGGGLFRLPPGGKAPFTRVPGIANDIIRSLLADSRGRIWVGTNGGGLACIEKGRIRNYTTAQGLPGNFIYSLGEDNQGRIWAGVYNGGLAVLEGDRFRAFGGAEISDQPVWVIYPDRQGDIWVGTDHAGLFWIRGEKIFRFASRDGMYSDQAFQILEDQRGRLWMNSNKGIYNVAKDDLIAFADGRLPRIPCAAYGKSEGIKVTESSGPAQPAGCIDRRGRIWFPTIRGLTMFDPDRQRLNRIEPPLAIEKALINGRSYDLALPAVAPPGKGNIEIAYTAISFLQVDKMRFAYRLDGFDTEWIEALGRRSAFYTNLPPGKYAFRVIAANGDGVWNRAGAAFAFTLRPYFTQTALFRWLLVLGALMLVTGFFLLLLLRAKARERTLERIVDERTGQLQRLARYDGLTDLANHRTFYEVFNREWAVAGREKKPLSVVTLDIDFFKSYNDSLGHQQGDECLRKVAMAIRSRVKRPADLAARTGGEEFFVLLPGTDKDGALTMAESIRAAIAALAIPHPSSPIAPVVTVSMGVSTVVPPSITEASEFISRADQALYAAKHLGRNRIQGEPGG
ncbi:MAG: diguanylate cyclase [Acidobacteria bacterium]|jgi:diguanylate cyclase (GGDEF)-like protein|nr:diguanylate cyclase [Acidobacteriota bacterium]